MHPHIYSHVCQFTRRWPLHLLTLVLTLILLNLPTDAHAQGPSGTYVTGIACVNIGTTSTTGTIDFYNRSGVKVVSVANPTMNPDDPWLLFTSNIGGLSSPFYGSAVVRAGQPITCSINQQLAPGGSNRVGSYGTINVNSVGTQVYATQIVNALGGFNSYVVLQNTGANATTVTASYVNADGTEAGSEAVNIPAYSSHNFYSTQAGLSAGFIGSASFTSSEDSTPIGGSVHIYNESTNQFMSFNLVNGGSNKVYLPRMVKNLSGVGYTSGWACQNLGTSAVDIEMAVVMRNQISNETVQVTLSKQHIGEGQSWTGYLGTATNSVLDDIERGVGSAVVTTSNGGEIACTVNEDNRTAFVGQGAAYNGVPDGVQATDLFIPQVVALGENSFRGGFQLLNTTADTAICTYAFSNGDVLTNQTIPGNQSVSILAENILTNNRTSFNGSVRIECNEPVVGLYNLSILGDAAFGDPYSMSSVNFDGAAVSQASQLATTQFVPEVTR